ncbi:hypothetical protein LRP88_01641 [Fusarium phalaenopsidis]
MAFGESVHDVVRDAPLGQLVRFFTNNRLFKYPEEQPNFKLPEPWVRMMSDAEPDRIPGTASSSTLSNSSREQETIEEHVNHAAEPDLEKKEFPQDKSTRLTPKTTSDGTILVDWYSEKDTANPHNWSNSRRGFVAFLICFYTSVVYLSSAIYSSSTEGVMKKFGVSNLEATLGLAMYVLGYGVGPLLFSPLSEIPRIGRNPIYIITYALFVILSVPTALVGNFPGLIVLRFLQGFFGSPCLAAGGASMSDLYSLVNLPFAMIAWVGAMSCGPSLGPLLSGFAVTAKNWRWSLYESIWISAPLLFVLFIFLPETIFEVFPLVYPVYYGMNLGQVGLVFLCIAIGCIIAIIGYGAFLYFVVTPRIKKVGMGPQENVLLAGLPTSFGPTIGLFIFAWTARASIHWIVPTIGITIYAGSIYTVLQCMFLYIPLSYPQYAASLFAANDLFRSAFASGSILFAHPLYANLGIAKGTSVLGGLSATGIIGMWLLYLYGAKLRALSKFAT